MSLDLECILNGVLISFSLKSQGRVILRIVFCCLLVSFPFLPFYFTKLFCCDGSEASQHEPI